MRAATDTIAAIATAAGRGGVGIVRLSGPRALAVAEMLAGRLPPPRQAGLRDLRDVDGRVLDRGLVLVFPAPASFTGEDVAELHAHGGPVLLNLLLDAACACGARRAWPGEFSERAFVNGRLDLVQAEAVADLIDAASAQGVRAASRSLQGEFSRQITSLVDALTALRADLEAALDFADEADVPWIDAARLRQRLAALRADLAQLRARAVQGQRLRDGLVVAIAGAPNVGKSTLLNALAGVDAAIVSPIAGTTRDVLREHLVMDGLPLTVIDTAGLRETDDPVEAEGVRRARAAIRAADLALLLVDDGEAAPTAEIDLALPASIPRIVLHNKCDLSGRPAGFINEAGDGIRLSAATGAGLADVRQALRRHAGLTGEAEGALGARARHLDALSRAAAALDEATALATTNAAAELIAEVLRQAQGALGEITGQVSADDLLGRIFSSFCIGK